MEDTGPVSWDEVLRAERAALRAPGAEGPPLRALCISGGGIRSATFALGAIQRLAEQGLLQQFDYLSTVSGGGYIGGWLTAWKQRAGGLEKVVPELVPNVQIEAGKPDPIEHLRAYNNYLTPRLGALSADTWTLATTVIRNVFLNWLVFVPLILAALMGPRLLLGLERAMAVGGEQTGQGIAALPWVAAALLVVSLWNILRYLPGMGGINHTTGKFLAWVLAPLVLAAILYSGYESLRVPTFWATLGGVLEPCLVAWGGGLAFGRRKRSAWRRRELAALLGAVMALGAGTGATMWALQILSVPLTWEQYLTVSVPLLLAGFSLAGAVFVGLSSHVLGTQDREWMARAAAYLGMVSVVWMVGCGAVVLAPGWVWGHPWKQWAAGGLGAAAGWAGTQVGFRAPSAPGKEGKGWGNVVVQVAPVVFLALLAVGLTILTDALVVATGGVAVPWSDHGDVVWNLPMWAGCAWAAGFAAVGWFMARYININKFSLQGMYRDRLIRAYLGASNAKGNANRFTGFSTHDDIAMQALDATQRPLHVVNMTLNLVAGERLAWQQRKAESFTATALHCGSVEVGYRPSSGYGGEGGITLGTAVAISGAAASPNMGYHSSPLVGFLMTLFNVRLGAWLGNPGVAGAKSWTHAGPRSATGALMREALGQTNDCSEYVYLSDGGHFENLGLYEMIRRRCKTIVVLDGGCDPNFTYEDLGNALRKIRIDLKVPIKFPEVGEAGLRVRAQRCAVARIVYSALDSSCEDGQLIYIKPVLLGTEPPDVTSYAAAHPSFPHQSTAEQWFDESQTESYRMLGIVTLADVCRGWEGRTLEELAAHLGAVGKPPSAVSTAVTA